MMVIHTAKPSASQFVSVLRQPALCYFIPHTNSNTRDSPMFFPGINVKIIKERNHQMVWRHSYCIARFGCIKKSKGHSAGRTGVTCEVSIALGLGFTLQSLSLELMATFRLVQVPAPSPTLLVTVCKLHVFPKSCFVQTAREKTLQGVDGYTVAGGFHPNSRRSSSHLHSPQTLPSGELDQRAPEALSRC